MRGPRFILMAMAAMLSTAAWGQEWTRGFDIKSPTVVAAKGTWMIGGNARYSTTTYTDGQIAIVEGVNSDSYSTSLTPSIAYLVADNFAVGVRGSYTRGLIKVDSASMGFGEVSIEVDDYYSLSHSGSAMLFARPFIPMGPSGRFSMFIDIAAGFRRGQAKVSDGHTGFTAGTWQQSFAWTAGVYPGLSAFISDHVALEFQLGMLGFDSSKVRQVHNQVNEGTRSSFSAHYMADVTSLAIGLTMYF